MMNKKWILLALVFFYSNSAMALEIFFNDVKVTGLRDQVFQNCTVKFDGNGNVYVTAKGYTVKVVQQSAPIEDSKNTKETQSLPAVAHKYYLVSILQEAAKTQYDVDVFINDKWVKKIHDQDPQVVLEVTQYLRPGKNDIQFVGTKKLGDKKRLSTAASDFLRVLIGQGLAAGDTVNITATLADFIASADKTESLGKRVEIDIK